MAVWLVRAGANGNQENFALDHNVAVVDWSALPDLFNISTREALDALCRETYPDENPHRITNHVGQLWAFTKRIQKDDLIVLPLKRSSSIAIGRVVDDYRFQSGNPPEARHTRPVEWIRKDIPRAAFDQDILYSFGAFMTVCQIQRNNAEARIRAVLTGKPAPQNNDSQTDASDGLVDLETYSRDLIRTHIGRKFRGHDLERLVGDVLRAQGYRVHVTRAGADGGLDILAGRGAFGFDAPRIGVQVKSSDQPLEASVLQNLQGALSDFGADQGLLVSWGGFKSSVEARARLVFFNIRLWDADDLVDALLENYDGLSEDVRAELPLKRIWTLVPQVD
jgi:restriction system protein